MKKFLALLLALLLMFSLAACGKQTANEPENTDKQEETTGTEQKDEQGTEQSDAQTGEENKQPDTVTGEGDAAAAGEEDIDLSNFTFGVQEIGGDVMVTVDNETEMGTVTCVMAFRYEGDTLSKETADYYVLDLETAAALAEELKADPSIIADSVKIREADKCVTCTMKDSEIEDLRSLTREELVEIMKYAVGAAE